MLSTATGSPRHHSDSESGASAVRRPNGPPLGGSGAQAASFDISTVGTEGPRGIDQRYAVVSDPTLAPALALDLEPCARSVAGCPMVDARITDERLRNHLNGRQPEQERLCAAVLRASPDYTHVKSLLPDGGRDGGKDLVARYVDGLEVRGGIGFVNNANDSSAHRRQAKKKFTEDCRSALAGNAALKHFVFFTNVGITPKGKEELERHGREQGLLTTDIYDRERIRAVLDSPRGYAYRLQFLDIEMTKEEQLSLFLELGDNLERLVAGRLSVVEGVVNRVEFLLERHRPLVALSLIVVLDRSYAANELGSIRVLGQLLDFRRNPPSPIARLAIAHLPEKDTSSVSLDTYVHIATEGGELVVGTGQSGPGRSAVDTLDCSGLLSSGSALRVIGDLEETHLVVHISKNLRQKLRAIALVANTPVVASATTGDFTHDYRDLLLPWPSELPEDAVVARWLHLVPMGLDFLSPAASSVGVPIRFHTNPSKLDAWFEEIGRMKGASER